ncbi:MAG: LPS export ABC transporter periplasmic protein LptC [Flavisolibacter sp.]|nr:LPS export ABC transporter periplasmic protein LptC [Flavisolibacter sp.]
MFFGCENSERAINEWNERRVLVEEARSIDTYFSQQGIMRARVKAPLMLRYQTDSTYVEFPKSLHVDFFDANKKVESWLDARYGKYIETTNKVQLRDSVRVININGDTLTSSELWWSQNEKKFYTDKEVRIATKDKRIYGGKGLEAAQDISWYIIKQPTGSVVVPENMRMQ